MIIVEQLPNAYNNNKLQNLGASNSPYQCYMWFLSKISSSFAVRLPDTISFYNKIQLFSFAKCVLSFNGGF